MSRSRSESSNSESKKRSKTFSSSLFSSSQQNPQLKRLRTYNEIEDSQEVFDQKLDEEATDPNDNEAEASLDSNNNNQVDDLNKSVSTLSLGGKAEEDTNGEGSSEEEESSSLDDNLFKAPFPKQAVIPLNVYVLDIFSTEEKNQALLDAVIHYLINFRIARSNTSDDFNIKSFLENDLSREDFPEAYEVLIDLATKYEKLNLSHKIQFRQCDSGANQCHFDVYGKVLGSGSFGTVEEIIGTINVSHVGKIFVKERELGKQYIGKTELSRPRGKLNETQYNHHIEANRMAAQKERNFAALDPDLRVKELTFFEDGTFTLVMQRVAGTSLDNIFKADYRDLKKKQNKINTNLRLQLSIQILRQLQLMHYRKIVHRDIKPANVIVEITDSHVTLKYVDFNLSTILNKNNEVVDKNFPGTIKFAPPEYWAHDENNPLTQRSDYYPAGWLEAYAWRAKRDERFLRSTKQIESYASQCTFLDLFKGIDDLDKDDQVIIEGMIHHLVMDEAQDRGDLAQHIEHLEEILLKHKLSNISDNNLSEAISEANQETRDLRKQLDELAYDLTSAEELSIQSKTTNDTSIELPSELELSNSPNESSVKEEGITAKSKIVNLMREKIKLSVNRCQLRYQNVIDEFLSISEIRILKDCKTHDEMKAIIDRICDEFIFEYERFAKLHADVGLIEGDLKLRGAPASAEINEMMKQLNHAVRKLSMPITLDNIAEITRKLKKYNYHEFFTPIIRDYFNQQTQSEILFGSQGQNFAATLFNYNSDNNNNNVRQPAPDFGF